MKRPRTSTLLGVAAGLALIAVAAHVLPGCAAMPPYIGIGFHFTTTPPTPQPLVIPIDGTRGIDAAAPKK